MRLVALAFAGVVCIAVAFGVPPFVLRAEQVETQRVSRELSSDIPFGTPLPAAEAALRRHGFDTACDPSAKSCVSGNEGRHVRVKVSFDDAGAMTGIEVKATRVLFQF